MTRHAWNETEPISRVCPPSRSVYRNPTAALLRGEFLKVDAHGPSLMELGVLPAPQGH